MANSTYEKLHAASKHTALLNSVQQLLDWDQETYMPHDAIHIRSCQSELLAGLVHKERTSKGFAKILFSLIDKETNEILESHLSERQTAALKRWKRDYEQAIKLPSGFVEQWAKTTSTATHVWKTAKNHNDFSLFAPHLEKIVALNRKKADLLGFEDHPYDALVDLYEPHMRTAVLTPLFNKLKLFLSEFLKEIRSARPIPDTFLFHNCPIPDQIEFAKILLKKMGFHSTSSRLDLTVHPFCTGLHPLDTRMTTKVHPENIMMNIGAVLHEGGHGLYNMQLPQEDFGSPLCESASLGIDESQSRFWETLIGQSEPFWRYFFPLLQTHFPTQFQQVTLAEFYHAINAVKPGLIRIDADEVSYNLHIILRFELEKGLIEGSIQVKDIPSLWNNKMRQYLGVSPEFDGQGCLQDIHWAMGAFGYFPTYTLGNLYAAQFFETLTIAHPTWEKSLSEGHLDPIREFLQQQIHRYGREFLPDELCQKVTGKPLSQEPYIRYLETKYRALYPQEV